MSEDENNDANTIDTIVSHHNDDITKEQLKVAEDIVQTLKDNQQKNIPLKYSIEQIENNYHIKKIPMMDVNKSLWYQMTKDEKIGANIQGYRQAEKDGKKIRIPYIAMGADLDYLDNMMRRLITKIRNLKEDK